MSIHDRKERLEVRQNCLRMFLERQECSCNETREEIKELEIELIYLQFCIENNIEKPYNRYEGDDGDE